MNQFRGEKMKVADMHCDTVYQLLEKRRAGEDCSLLENALHMDLRKMQKGDYLIQNFALFVEQSACDDPYEEAKAEYAVFAEEMKKHAQWIRQVKTYEEIEQCQKEGKLAALLTIEEGEVCRGELEKLEEFYALGARMMALVWNYDNSLSTVAVKSKRSVPRSYQGKREGLTETGIAFVERMEELGMIPDVSHMSDAGIEDMLDITKNPFVASHSNAKALCPHSRNLNDTLLKRMGEKGCVIGTNFCSRFLQTGADFTKTAWLADHILYMVNAAGLESVGLGSDFDGIENALEMENCAGIQTLAEELRRRGMSEAAIEHIFYKNVLRLYREVL